MFGQWALDILARLASVALRFKTPGGPPYRVTPMLPGYVGEDVPGNPIWSGDTVRYLTAAERAACALTFRNGLIYDAQGNLFDTASAATVHSDVGRAIFVMDADGNFYASRYQAVGEFHHSSLVAGAPVAAAGELEVSGGVLRTISDKSGHYRPPRRYTAQAVVQLKKNNISLHGVAFDFIGRA